MFRSYEVRRRSRFYSRGRGSSDRTAVVAERRLLPDLRPQLPGLERRRRRRPAGIRSRLPYLQELGVDALWLTPFYPSPQADHGYDVADYVDVDPLFGTLADFDALVARRARARDQGDDRHRPEPHLRPARVVPERDRRPGPPRSRALHVPARTERRPAERLDVRLRRPRLDARRARPASTTSTSSRPSSPISTGTTRPSRTASTRSSASGSTEASTASGSTSRTRSSRRRTCRRWSSRRRARPSATGSPR